MDETGTERGGGLPAMGPGIRGRGARRAQFAAAQRRGLFPGNSIGTAAVLGLKPDRYRVKSTARATRCMCVTRYFAPHSRAVDRPRAGICVRLSSSRIPRPCSCAVFPYVSFRLLHRPAATPVSLPSDECYKSEPDWRVKKFKWRRPSLAF